MATQTFSTILLLPRQLSVSIVSVWVPVACSLAVRGGGGVTIHRAFVLHIWKPPDSTHSPPQFEGNLLFPTTAATADVLEFMPGMVSSEGSRRWLIGGSADPDDPGSPFLVAASEPFLNLKDEASLK